MNNRLNFCRVLALAACALGVCVLPASVHGQDSGNQVAGEDVNPLRLLDDFEHYVVIQQREMAAAVGQQLLDLGLTPREFLDLVKSTRDVGRFLKAVDRAASIAELDHGTAEFPVNGASPTFWLPHP